jgi:hypothetical protein
MSTSLINTSDGSLNPQPAYERHHQNQQLCPT